jgi:hypothetical protein
LSAGAYSLSPDAVWQSVLPPSVTDAQDGIDLNAWNDKAAFAAVENKLVSEADFIELRGVFSKNDRLAPGSGAYLQSVQAALAAGRVVFDSE